MVELGFAVSSEIVGDKQAKREVFVSKSSFNPRRNSSRNLESNFKVFSKVLLNPTESLTS